MFWGGHYAQHLRQWLRHFPAEQLAIVSFAMFTSCPREVLADLDHFIHDSPTHLLVPASWRRRQAQQTAKVAHPLHASDSLQAGNQPEPAASSTALPLSPGPRALYDTQCDAEALDYFNSRKPKGHGSRQLAQVKNAANKTSTLSAKARTQLEDLYKPLVYELFELFALPSAQRVFTSPRVPLRDFTPELLWGPLHLNSTSQPTCDYS